MRAAFYSGMLPSLIVGNGRDGAVSVDQHVREAGPNGLLRLPEAQRPGCTQTPSSFWNLRRLELETAWIFREVALPRPLSNAASASRFKQELERKPSRLTLESD